MRPEAVEIKVTFDQSQVEKALAAFEPMPDRQARNVYFCEDVTGSVRAGTPLLDSHLVLRIRTTEGGAGDSTIKLRPCRGTQLTERWLNAAKDDDRDFKVEADWAGPRRVLAVSCARDLPAGLFGQVLAGDESVQSLFSQRQEQFLTDCGNVRVNLASVTMLPPVMATRWGPFRTTAPDPKLKIVAERWVVDNALDFLELSVRADPDDAERKGAALEALVLSRGLQLDPDQETKTRRVLDYLVNRLGPTPAG